ncbi:MAG: helix-turn-helix transcriptional regulator [Phycisphaerales bacterium]|nr:MAG: helix-turn-helix transcriptional regulator [Phycisphaerales bacterium]
MIIVKLKEAMQAYRRRTGRRLTYAILHEATGISTQALGAIATRQEYNPTLATIDKICRELAISPGELLEYVPSERPNLKQTQVRRRTPKKKTKRTKP